LLIDRREFRVFSRGIMSVVSMMDGGRRRSRASAGAGALSIRCSLFGPGREDWNRGLRELRATILHVGELRRMADGAIVLHGIPSVDLRLDRVQIDRILKHGLRIPSGEFEIEIEAASFARALSSLPGTGRVLPFPPRARL